MNVGDGTELRAAALFLDRHRARIAIEVDRRLARADPPPAARAEIVRRFRSYCRLASVHPEAARPSLDGLWGNSSVALESAVSVAVDAACGCDPPPEIARALRGLEATFRSGIRRSIQPEPPEGKRRRRRNPNAGRRVRSAIDRISDAYLALCLETGRVYDVNPAAEALLGQPAGALLEREFVSLLGPESRDLWRGVEARLDAGEDAGPLQMAFARGDGGRVPVELAVANHTIGGRRFAIFIARERNGSNGHPSLAAYSTRST